MLKNNYRRFEDACRALIDCTTLLEDEGWFSPLDSSREKEAASDMYIMAQRYIDAYKAAVPTPLQQRAGLTLK